MLDQTRSKLAKRVIKLLHKFRQLSSREVNRVGPVKEQERDTVTKSQTPSGKYTRARGGNGRLTPIKADKSPGQYARGDAATKKTPIAKNEARRS